MNPAQLLNPKGYAKAQEKAKKKAPNYGPPQARKPTGNVTSNGGDIKPAVVKYDPKALLNPKAAASSARAKSTPETKSSAVETSSMNHTGQSPSMGDNQLENGLGASSFIERQYGVTAREAAPAPKRKSQAIDDTEDQDDIERKKAKSTFNGAANGGTLGSHLKAEREKFAAESDPVTATIDLTNDDDEIVFVGETKRDDSREVCLGKLPAKAMIFRIPRTSKTNKGALPGDQWPMLRVHYRRTNIQTYAVDLVDRDPNSSTGIAFGKLDVISAAALCPLIDGSNVNKLRLKIFVDAFRRQPGEYEGARVSRSINLSIILYSPLDKAQGIGTWLSQKQLFLSAPVNNPGRVEYHNPQAPVDHAPVKVRKTANGPQVSYGVARTEEDMRRDAEGLLETLFEKQKELPQMDMDTNTVTTPLMAHQREALYFLTQHERGDEDGEDAGFSLWKSRMGIKGETWFNIITNHEIKEKPQPMRGGILADMMGLGKTLSILALITSTMNDARTFGEADAPDESDYVERNSKATLIICPKSVLSNWQEQVKQHTKRGILQIYNYHGPSRTQDVDELANYDIVLTSYSTAASEFSDRTKKRNALAAIQWFRIVLDEAHQIRTQNTQFFQSCRALAAQRRWAVTGTPVQNRLDDFGALVKFLRLKPFDDGNSWATHILAPFRSGNENATDHLRLIVHGITLRRMKDKIGFTARNEKIVRLEFGDKEMLDYKLFSQNSNRQLKLMIREHGRLKGKSYAHVLKSVSRLRAYCAHGREMLHEEDMKELEGLTASTAIELGDEPDEDGAPDDSFISEKHAYETLQMMSDSEADVCTICGRKVGDNKMDPEADPAPDSRSVSGDEDASSDSEEDDEEMGYITPCYHLICPDCKDQHITTVTPKLTQDHYHHCPYCEQYVRFGLFELRRSALKAIIESRRKMNKKRGKAKWDESTYSGPSTKVKALLDDLKSSAVQTASLAPDQPPIRSVVFSGWTTYLDLIEHALEENNIGFVRLDGTMSLKARANVIATFKSDPTITVLLVSIKAGGQGLNFTAANKVYMMEPQFNPGVEQQAIDRVHRLGQTRDVEITHYIMRESVEEGILTLQEKKMKLAQMSLEKKKGVKGEEAKKRIEELKELFK